MRTFFIWLCGLLAGACIGGLIGGTFPGNDSGFFGLIGGMAVFACARLWLAPRPLGM